jgi:hypothetical protein
MGKWCPKHVEAFNPIKSESESKVCIKSVVFIMVENVPTPKVEESEHRNPAPESKRNPFQLVTLRLRLSDKDTFWNSTLIPNVKRRKEPDVRN